MRGIIEMRKMTKIAAAALALAMMVPVFSGCKKRGTETVSGDDAWYNLNKIQLEQSSGLEDIDYVYTNYVCTYEDGFVFHKAGNLVVPDGVDRDTVDMNDYYFERLEIYDGQGNLTHTYDLQSLMRQVSGDYVSVTAVNPVDGGITVTVSSYDFANQTSEIYRATINVASDTVSELTLNTSGDTVLDDLLNAGGSDEGTFKIGSYSFHKVWFSSSMTGSVASYDIVAIDEEGRSVELDLRSLYPNLEVYNIDTFLDMGDNKVLVLGTGSDGSVSGTGSGSVAFIIDTASMTITRDNSDWSWISDRSYLIRQVDGAGTVMRDDDGLYTIDFANQTLVPLFLYTSSNVNAYEVSSLTPMYVTEERALFSGTPYNPMPGVNTNDSIVIYEFTKADSNPNAGKTILDIACVGNLSYPLCQAVCDFNETNSDFFMRFDMSYQIEINYDGEGDYAEKADNAATTLGNQLAMDIMSGTGPDIIVNGSQFGMINNSEYLLNMSDFVADNCSADSYYTNIFDTAKIAGELFQVPLCFSIQGIVTDADNVDPGQIGFTFEQYQAFVDGPCNGNAPINQGRMYFFMNSLNCMTDLMNEDQIVNYDNEAFRSLAEYTAQYVNEVMPSDEGSEYEEERPAGYMCNISNVAAYFNSTKNGEQVILGIPSYDGRGPIISSADTVAVSAQTVAPDACREFVLTLLGSQIQEMYGYQNGLPVERSAFSSVGSRYVDMNNNELDRNLRMYSEAEMIMYGMNTIRMDDSAIADLSDLVDDLTGWYINDGSINAIIREEMPAYFEGQKTLDQIIPVLEDRVQTVINERR